MLGVTTLCLIGYAFKKEQKKIQKNPVAIKRYFLSMMCVGFPVFNIYLFSLYRRYFSKVQFEDKLKIKYRDDIKVIENYRSEYIK
jgi:hypothetical protein